METIDLRWARRLALARAGLLKPRWTGMPQRAAGAGKRARDAAHRVVGRFGYLQLDSVPVSGARTHGLVLLSRIEGFAPQLAEELLAPGEPLFEYWGHETCWLPMKLYPYFEFRRQECVEHPWWGDVLAEHPEVTAEVLDRIRDAGPLRSVDFRDAASSGGWWEWGAAKKVLSALWSRGDLAIRRRVHFHRVYDLAERVIPAAIRAAPAGRAESVRLLLLRALAGHGWATSGTLAATWRFRNMQHELRARLAELQESGLITACGVADGDRVRPGWIRPSDLELAERLGTVRPRRDRGVLLSPFDPVLWDRDRVRQLFGFEQMLEIYKPREQRKYGYYCTPVLAGERCVGRLDLKADRKAGRLRVQSVHFEADPPSAADRVAVTSALRRFATALDLEPDPLATVPAV